MHSDVIRRVEQLATQEKHTSSLVFLDRHKHPISDDTSAIPDDAPATDNFISSNDDTNAGDNSPSDIPIARVMGGDNNNTDPNITGVTDEELARANEISQENDDCQEVEISTDTRQEVATADHDVDNDSDDEELPPLILCDASYDSDNDDDDSDDDDDDDKDDVKDNDDDDSDDEGLPGLTTRGDDSDSDDDSDEEEPLPDSGSLSRRRWRRANRTQKDTRLQKKEEDPIIVRFKDPRFKKKEKQKKRRSSRLQRHSAKVTRSPHILIPSQQRVMGMKTRGKKLSYSHRYTMVIHHVLTHYSVKAGIKKFGAVGTIAVSDEPQQLHTKDTFTPVKATTLSPEQKKRALRSLMFVKKKLDVKRKGRACTDGWKQQDLYAKEDASSPTVSIETVLLTSVIDALENRDVAVTDIPGVYHTTDIDEEVHIILEGKLAEMMVLTAPEVYRTNITTSKNDKHILYVKLNKHCMDNS